MPERAPTVAIIDYGMGNLFSVSRACDMVGLSSVITSSPNDIENSNGIILPGVGAFGDAMDALHSLKIVSVLKSVVQSGKPFMGICLGMQLLMDESFEFGRFQGLGLLRGSVVRFEAVDGHDQLLKVPHIGWSRISPVSSDRRDWKYSPLSHLPDDVYMYFVHSFYVKLADSTVTLSTTHYRGTNFCSALRSGNIFAVQFHPERSGPDGIKIYQGFLEQILKSQREIKNVH